MAVLGVRLKAEEVPGAVLEHSVISKNKVLLTGDKKKAVCIIFF